MNKLIAELEKIIVSQAKEIAELKVQVSVQPGIDVNVLAKELEFYRSNALHKTE